MYFVIQNYTNSPLYEEGDIRKLLSTKELFDRYPTVVGKIYRPSCFPILISLVSKDSDIHYGLFDFDDRDPQYVVDMCKLFNISGHMYKTGHGVHLYTDRTFRRYEYIQIATDMFCCEGHIQLGDIRGYWGLRVGLKEKRPPDINYIGHTSGLDVAKTPLLKLRDCIYERAVQQWIYDKKYPEIVFPF